MAQDLSPAQRTLTVGVLGAGTVGSQVIRLLSEQADDFAARSGARLEITGVAVRDVNAPRDASVSRDLLTDDATAVATGNDLVIELIGGIEPARTLILAAFKAGASVITGNKALIAAHGPELYTAAAAAGTDFYYEAAVAGAIPVVYALRESMAGDRVTSVLGIVNGTTNYILDEMSIKGLSFETALATAQELGYAEADPTADVDGLDAAAKAAIIASLAFHTAWASMTSPSKASVKSPPTTSGRPTPRAASSSCSPSPSTATTSTHKASPCGSIPPSCPTTTRWPAFTAPTTPSSSRPRAPGASCSTVREREEPRPPQRSCPTSSQPPPTGSTAARPPASPPTPSLPVLGPEAAVTRYQIQLRSDDAVGSLAAMASVFAENEVSINSVRQSAYVTSDGSHDQAVVTFVTHPAPVFHLDAAVEGLRDSDRVAEVVSIQRVEGE